MVDAIVLTVLAVGLLGCLQVWISRLASASPRRAALAYIQALQRQTEEESGKPSPHGGQLIRGDQDHGAPRFCEAGCDDLAQPYRELARRIAIVEHGQRLLWQRLEQLEQELLLAQMRIDQIVCRAWDK